MLAAHGGEIVEWLVEDGDLVSPGQPLLRLYPDEVVPDGTDHPGRGRPAPRDPGHRRLPRQPVVPNSEIIDAIDSADEWIQHPLGDQVERRLATPEETVQ